MESKTNEKQVDQANTLSGEDSASGNKNDIKSNDKSSNAINKEDSPLLTDSNDKRLETGNRLTENEKKEQISKTEVSTREHDSNSNKVVSKQALEAINNDAFKGQYVFDKDKLSKLTSQHGKSAMSGAMQIIERFQEDNIKLKKLLNTKNKENQELQIQINKFQDNFKKSQDNMTYIISSIEKTNPELEKSPNIALSQEQANAMNSSFEKIVSTEGNKLSYTMKAEKFVKLKEAVE
jgi:hypothetical protein